MRKAFGACLGLLISAVRHVAWAVADAWDLLAMRLERGFRARRRLFRPRTVVRESRGALAWSWLVIALAGVLSAALVVQAVPRLSLDGALKTHAVQEVPDLAESTVLLDAKGRRIATLYGEQNRITIPRKHMPKHLRRAVLAIEDDDFYRHGGIRLRAIARAAIANLAEGGIQQGGSTITQQYARNVFPEIGRGRTITRKVKEALMARELERRYSKDDILDRYLNTVYFGRGAYGVEAAARSYFGKPARALRLHQAALLAGVIHAPERYSNDAKTAKTRRNLVLRRMHELRYITDEQIRAATRTPVRYRDGTTRARAAYFVEYVRRLLRTPKKHGGFGLSDEQILAGGLRVHTTLDLDMQKAAERAVRKVLDRDDDPEAGMVAMTTDGRIRAMVGGRRFTSIKRARGFNYAVQMSRGGGRQAGSVFKTFTLAAYLEEGGSPRRYFSAPSRTTVTDPKCRNGDGSPWRPANYGNQGYGGMTVIEATEKSVNTVYAQMVARVGPSDAVRMARAAGIVSPLEAVCSIALGTMGISPLELARAYATFAARGMRPDPIAITRIVARNGRVIMRGRVRQHRAIDAEVADKVNAILEGVMERGTGTPAAIDRESAGKTGTTDDRRDVWFAGYTPHPGLAAAVWIGHPPDEDGRIRTMNSLHGVPATGGRFAGGIWKLFMERALQGLPETEFADVDLGSGEQNRWWEGSADGGSWDRSRDDDDADAGSGDGSGERVPPGQRKKRG